MSYSKKNNKSKKWLVFCSLFLICLLFIAYNQYIINAQEENVKHISILMGSDLRKNKALGLIEGLKKYGYEQGVNIKFTIVSAKDKINELPKLAQSLVEQNPDVLIGTGEKEILALQQATKENKIPVVFIGVGLAQDLGFVESYLKPGGNITGVDNYYLKLSGKRLEYFKRLLPDIQKVMVLYDETVTPASPTVEFLNQVASQLNIELIPVGVTNKSEAESAILNADKNEIDGIMLLCSLLMESLTDTLSPLIKQKNIPALGVSENQTKKGFLASYGMSYREQGIQASRIVAKVLQGQSPALIPVETPAQVDFIINSDVAESFKDRIEPSGFACATKFIR